MEYIDVTIRESVYLKNGMTEEKVLRFLPYYVKYMLFPEVKAIEICFLDNLKHDLLSYNEEFCISAHEIVKNRFSMVAVIHPDLVDISGWDSEVIKLFKTVRFMINAPINKHCIEIIRYLKSLGVEISLNIIYISNKDENFIRNCVEIANAENVDYFCLADSNGSCFPKDIIEKMTQTDELHSNIMRNVHLHNHLGLALTNALSCYYQLNLLDCSIHGIGKGGGNLSLENIILIGRILKKQAIKRQEIIAYAQLLQYLFDDILEEDGTVQEEYKNILIGLFDCSLKNAKRIEDISEKKFIRFCELISDEEKRWNI